MTLKTILTTLTAVLLITSLLAAAVPQLINYQGQLTEANGTPSDGNFLIKFIIYDAPSGGNILWDGNFQSVVVTNGLFEVQLGASPMPPLPDNLFRADTIRYLGITVGTDPEISPRIKLTSVAYAYQSLRADSSDYTNNANFLDGLDATNFASTDDLTNHEINPSAHHVKYTDAEAVTALSNHTTDSSAHHVKYTDAEAVSALSGHTNNPSAHHTKTTNAGDITSGTLSESVLPSNIAKLNANQTFTGNNTFNKISYSSPRTHYFVVGGEGFLPGKNDAYSNSYDNGGAYIISGYGAMAAPIHLPNGAVVTELKVFFYDNSTSDVSVSLGRLSFSGGYGFLAIVSSSNISGYGSSTDNSIGYSTINNLSYSYHLRAYSSSWDSANLRIMGALVTYTINEAP